MLLHCTGGIRTPSIIKSSLAKLCCWRFRCTVRCSLFSATNSIPQSRAQDVADIISLDKRAQVYAESFPVVCIVVSSSKIEALPSMWLGRSLIYSRNNVGPRTVPWGIPALGERQSDKVHLPSHTVFCHKGRMKTTPTMWATLLHMIT